LKAVGKGLDLQCFYLRFACDKSGIPALVRGFLWRYFAQPVAIHRPDQGKNEFLVNFATGSRASKLLLDRDSTVWPCWD
jgi:hypothetical protein